MRYIFLVTFIISSVIHLIASFKQNKPLRNLTKGFILFSLLSWYLLNSQNPSWLVVIAILTSWVGDLLLIGPGVKWFTAGGISFMVSHIFFILSYVEYTDFTRVPWYIIVILGIIYASAVTIIFKNLKPHLPKPLFYPMFGYLLINGAMNCFAIFRAISNPSFITILVAVGALCFFISDSTLFFVRFNKESKIKTHFIVMLTYILAEFLIVQGFIL